MNREKEILLIRKNRLQLYLVLSFVSVLFSCKKENHENIYAYGTPEFEAKSKELKYNLNDAVDIYCKYVFEKTQKDSIRFYIRMINNGDYVFSTIPYNDKAGYCYLDGYWINGETGEIKKVDSGEYIKIILEKYAPAIRIVREQFEKNGGSAFSQKIDTQ